MYIAAVEAGAQEKWRKDRMKLSIYHKNWWEKLFWLPVILLCKIFIPSYTLDALLWYETGCSHPLNHETLQITLICLKTLEAFRLQDSITIMLPLQEYSKFKNSIAVKLWPHSPNQGQVHEAFVNAWLLEPVNNVSVPITTTPNFVVFFTKNLAYLGLV
jgi:hypothetical protein